MMLALSRLALLFLAAASATAFEYKPYPEPAGYPALPAQQCEQEPTNLPDGGIFRPAQQGLCDKATTDVCVSKKCVTIAANFGTKLCLVPCNDGGKCFNEGLQSWIHGCQPKLGGGSVDPWNVAYPGPNDERAGACTNNKDFPCVLTRKYYSA